MKVYVDKLPKTCSHCPCGVDDDIFGCWCKAGENLVYITEEKFDKERLEDCPLKEISTVKKQTINEVIDTFGKNVAVDYVRGKLYARVIDIDNVFNQLRKED